MLRGLLAAACAVLIACSGVKAANQVDGGSAASGRIVIVALGASNTAGKGVWPQDAYPAQLEKMLREAGRDVIVRNAGISGDTTGRMLGRLDSAVPEGARLVILQPGGNDRRRGTDELRSGNIEEMIGRLRARGIKVVMLENSMLGAIPSNLHQNDGEHLTPEGYRLLAAHLLPEVLTVLGP